MVNKDQAHTDRAQINTVLLHIGRWDWQAQLVFSHGMSACVLLLVLVAVGTRASREGLCLHGGIVMTCPVLCFVIGVLWLNDKGVYMFVLCFCSFLNFLSGFSLFVFYKVINGQLHLQSFCIWKKKKVSKHLSLWINHPWMNPTLVMPWTDDDVSSYR